MPAHRLESLPHKNSLPHNERLNQSKTRPEGRRPAPQDAAGGL